MPRLSPATGIAAGSVAVAVLAIVAAATGHPAPAVSCVAVLGLVSVGGMLDVRRRVRHSTHRVDRVAVELGSVVTGDELVRSLARSDQSARDAAKRTEEQLGELDRKLDQLAAGHRRDSDVIRRLSFEPVNQQQALLQLTSRVTARAPLPDVGGWALDPTTLLELVDVIRAELPRLIVECGSGSSTIWLAYALEAVGSGRLVSVDHEAEFAARTRHNLRRHGLQQWAEVRDAPLTDLAADVEPARWYRPDAFADLAAIDLLVVDGPPEATGRQARLPAYPMLVDRLADTSWILLDDTMRAAERSAVTAWTEDPRLRVEREIAGRATLLRFTR